MAKKYVIGWRPPGSEPIFYRGTGTKRVFLPFVSSTSELTRGWVETIWAARVFDGYPCLCEENISNHLNVDYIRIFPYDGQIIATQLFIPLKRKKRF